MTAIARRMPTANLRRAAGMTLLEVMIAIAVFGLMMMLTWRTIYQTANAKEFAETMQIRNRELRVAMGRLVADFECAYLSQNEEGTGSYPRTQFVGKSGGVVPEIRFSTMCHRVLWADANESDQTLISYQALNDKRESSKVNLIRREQRRLSHRPLTEEPAEYDVLLRDITKLELEFWDYKNESWKDRWDTTAADGERGRLPTRVRITVVTKLRGSEYKIQTEARLLLEERLNFAQ